MTSNETTPAETAQQPIVEALTRELAAATGEPVKRIDTHAAIILLAGAQAIKFRRAIRLPFLDYSTLEKRRAAAEAEIALNHDAAPSIYRDAVAVVRRDGGYAIGGDGEVVEWITRMRRFDEEATLDKLAERGELTSEQMVKLARVIAASHARAAVRPAAPAIRCLETWIGQNRAAFRERPELFPNDEAERLDGAARAALERLRPLLLQRGEAGWVRRCHGDLHLKNIALVDGEPTPFDAIEFDDAIATGDVLYDLAFAIMDLVERGETAAANTLLNGYLTQGDEALYAGLAALPLFLSVRAAIRAKVEAANLLHLKGGARDDTARAARRYFAIASEFLTPKRAALVAVGGLSGSGKSRLARALAPGLGRAPGAVWLSSDIERKHLCGVGEDVALPDSAYDAATTREVYARLRRRALLALRAGQATIVDATHARAEARRASAALADDAGQPFRGLWLEAPLSIRLTRIGGRSDDASDADERVARAQSADPIAEPGWTTLDASESFERLAARASAQLKDLA